MRNHSRIVIAAILLAGCRSRTSHDDAQRASKPAVSEPQTPRHKSCSPHEPHMPKDLESLEALWQSTKIPMDLDGAKLTRQERQSLMSRKDAVATASREWENARDRVAIACLEFVKARNDLSAVLLEPTNANQDASDAMERIASIIRCWSYTAQPRQKLNDLEDALVQLEKAASAASEAVKSSAASLKNRFGSMVDARLLVQPAFQKYVGAAEDLATELKGDARHLGAKSEDAAELVLLTSRIPQMHEASIHLELLVLELSVESGAIDGGAGSMCENVTSQKEFTGPIASSKSAALELQERWVKQRQAVESALADIFRVPGTEL